MLPFSPEGTFSPRDTRLAREITMGSGSRRKTALAEGVCFSVRELFHFLPRPAACALQNGCSVRLPGWSHGPSLLLPGLRRGSVLQTLQLCQVQREALTHGWSESHLTHRVPWSCARTSASQRTVWRWVSGQCAGRSGVGCWLLRPGHLPRSGPSPG